MNITPALFDAVYEQPWNIYGSAWRSLSKAMQAPQSLDLSDFFQSRTPMQIDSEGIAHISISGVLGNHAPIAGVFGDTDYGLVTSELLEAERNALGVMVNVSTPGGQSSGNIEAAKVLSNLSIPTAAFCDGMACSAGYAYASGADHIVSAPSALVGSVGVIIPRIDESEAWAKAGIKPDYIVSDELKGAGMPPSLTPEQREHLQEIVDDLASQFKEHVLSSRAIDQDSMRGQAFVAPRAKDLNLVDEIGSADTAYKWLQSRIG